MVIEGAKSITKQLWMAPMLVEYEDKKVILLPGPPSEMQPMAKNELLPYLMDEDRVIIRTIKIRWNWRI